MKIIDRYIIGKYLTTFVFTVCIFCLVIVIFDFSEKVDDFNKRNFILWQPGLISLQKGKCLTSVEYLRSCKYSFIYINFTQLFISASCAIP